MRNKEDLFWDAESDELDDMAIMEVELEYGLNSDHESEFFSGPDLEYDL